MTAPSLPSPLPPDRSHILTEQRNPRSGNLHAMSVREVVELINEEDRRVAEAVGEAGGAIAGFVEAAEEGFAAGGRLIYVGAGTSGRLGVLDASECPPTFQTEAGRVVGIIAGGDAALRRSSEGKEDERYGAREELAALRLTGNDCVLGIAAGGTTPYVLGALELAKTMAESGVACPRLGVGMSSSQPGDGKTCPPRAVGMPHSNVPLTGLLVCSPIERPEFVDHLIVVATGPEVLTGSTRMKAGTATKMVLNTISTTLMVRAGRVYGNLMVDVRATNNKLTDRAARIVSALTGLGRDGALDLVRRAGGGVKTAVVMHRRSVSREEAERLLSAHGGRLDVVIDGRRG